MGSVDAVVVGSGPNGLAAAVTLAEAGRSVLVLEAAEEPGGGLRSAELTLPGFLHDVCSAIHPLAAASPFFADAGLDAHGLALVHPEHALVHPLDGGRAGVLDRSLDSTAAGLGADGRAWRSVVGWAARRWEQLSPTILGPILRVPPHPVAVAGFGVRAAPPATVVARRFANAETRALWAGCSAHSFMRLEAPFSAAFGVMLAATAHVAGWPVAAGGSASIASALVDKLTASGGEVRCGEEIRDLRQIPPRRALLFDLTPRQVADIAGDALGQRERRRFERYRYGPGIFKVDYALREPVPWENRAARRAGTVHLGGTIEEIARAEAAVLGGEVPERPFVLVGQQSLVDRTRAPEDRHTLWAYCHVPNGSTVDMTDAIDSQIERFAPGFRDVVEARHTADTKWFERHDANFVGGDINGGSFERLGLFLRPGPGLHPYRTSNPSIFLCSSSTPPGGGVHGMCGMNAARDVLATALA